MISLQDQVEHLFIGVLHGGYKEMEDQSSIVTRMWKTKNLEDEKPKVYPWKVKDIHTYILFITLKNLINN